MSEEEQRIAIAEACGWTKTWAEKGTGQMEFHSHPVPLPDYLNDLNAMHEAVAYAKTQYNDPESDGLLFCEATYIMTLNVLLDRNHWDCEFCIVEATAAQRAEAFLKTIGQYKGSKPESVSETLNPQRK